MCVIFDSQAAVFSFHSAVNNYHEHGCFMPTSAVACIWKRKRGYAPHTWVFVIWNQRVDGEQTAWLPFGSVIGGEGLLKFTAKAAFRCLAQMLGIVVLIVLVGLHEALE